jgi:hypothetical protein
MFGMIKDHWVYIKCPKNGCMTFTTLLDKHGWETIDLFDRSLDLSKLVLWGHITDPHQRHTKGLVQYLQLNPDIDYNDPKIQKLLVSAVFDEHTYSLSMMLSHIFYLPIEWIPLDAAVIRWNAYPIPPEELHGDDLTNDWFREQNIDIQVSISDHLNISTDAVVATRDKINGFKEQYQNNYNALVKNFLEHDLRTYYETLAKFRKKYLDPEQTRSGHCQQSHTSWKSG